jgi:hypothetical protein
MKSFKRISSIASWLVFAIAMTVFFFSAERTGSLWDCGEFILGAYKLQVVHPPGAPMFLLIGRLFTWVAELLSDDPADIAFAVNLMSGLCTAFAAFFIARITMMLGKPALTGTEEAPDLGQSLALAGAGIVGGLTTAFATSVWFSAVEGEVYAMSTFFTTLTLWAMVKWYSLPPSPQNDRWIIFAVYAAGLSTGVHLLSLLTFPALALFYYFKRYNNHSLRGIAAAAGVGVAFILGIQLFIIVGIPKLWSAFELLMVNGLGLPFHTGLIPTLLVVFAVIFFGLRYAHRQGNPLLQYILVGAALVVISFSTIGVVVLRANANTPINMNEPSDAMRLLPYLNREQYGERALLRGPHFEAQPTGTKVEDRYGRVGDHYEIVDQKIEYVFDNRDKMFFPRMGDFSQGRPRLYKRWMGVNPDAPLPPNRPNQLDNISFFVRYQLGWMYWRYFMWNFSGRQNGEQGYEPWNKADGHWLSGIRPIDNVRLYNQSEIPESMRADKARNKYYMLPFFFGLIGLFFHFRQRPNDATALMALFIITGIGIIVYSNQPPREPRERDYVLAGSFFTYAIWVGMAVLFLFDQLRKRVSLSGPVAGAITSVVVLIAPALMGFENFDDHSRLHHTGARDYANNFLESCEPNAIIFTYGDNDTYPLWYAQEVEGIRPDVRVVNLSLIAVDWYINQLRRKINDSPPIKLTIPADGYRGSRRNQVYYYDPNNRNQAMSLKQILKFIGEYHPLRAGSGRELESYLPSSNVYIPVDSAAVLQNGIVSPLDAGRMVRRIPVKLPVNQRKYLLKDELAILDIIGSNLWDRPIYFAVTVRPEKIFGMDDFLRLEGLALRFVPYREQSEPQYGVAGSGSVNTDAVYTNVMNKFRWGNFDKYDLYVNDSYAPSVQSHQLMMRRTALEMLNKGDHDRALELVDKYFEVFPHMNFPYDYRAYSMIQVYLEAGAYDRAKPHMEILAQEVADYLEFFASISDRVLESSFSTDYSLNMRMKDDLLRVARENKDEEFVQRLETLFAPFQTQPIE